MEPGARPAGLLQWQCAVPPDATDDLRWIVQQISASGQPSFLAVLKRFGPGNAGPLSFPVEGWTLALDVPAGADPDLGQLLDRLDDRGRGRRPALPRQGQPAAAWSCPEAMYPRLDEWRKVRDAADPDGRLASDLGRRLGLIG
nr:hypothetical protein [Aquihabitans sp. G128]